MPGMSGGAVRQDPLIQANFYLELKGKLQATMVFREASGIGSESDVVEYKGTRQNDYHTIQAIPGRLKWTKINLKRGVTSDADGMAIWKWRKLVEDGKVEDARTDGSIVMMNQNGDPVATWNFKRAWPSKVSGPSLNSATGTEVGVEEVEIVHEGLERVS